MSKKKFNANEEMKKWMEIIPKLNINKEESKIMNKKDMCLVQGDVTFTINVCTLIPADKENDEDYVKELLVDRAYKDLSSGGDEDVEYNNSVLVTVSEETAKEYEFSSICDFEWKAIVEESKRLK
jgi:hypothetical protein